MTTELTLLGSAALLVRPLGSGATSQVWLVDVAGLGPRAVKFARDASQRLRFADEGERCMWVDSPAFARLMGAGMTTRAVVLGDGGRLDAGTPYLVFEWVDGEPLSVVSAREDVDRSKLSLQVARDIGGALAELHAAHVAHGDVKPENILIESFGQRAARLLDLGLAQAALDDLPRGGTRRYLAPEVFDAAVSGDARARDLWALGRVLAEICDPELVNADDVLEAMHDEKLGTALSRIVRALLSRAPAARPSAEWVRRVASSALSECESEQALRERRERAVRRSYLNVRRREIQAAARFGSARIECQGIAAKWLNEALGLAREVARFRATPTLGQAEPVLGELDAAGRARFLVSLIGPSAAAWPTLSTLRDSEFAERLLGLCAHADPESFSFGDLQRDVISAEDGELSLDPLELALALRTQTPDPALVRAAEHHVLEQRGPLSLALVVASILRLRGELGRALSLLEPFDDDAALIEAAEIARRAHDTGSVRERLSLVSLERCSSKLRSRALAIAARLELDSGEPGACLGRLATASDSAQSLETRALAEIALAERTKARATLESARLAAGTDEERARIEAVAGMLAHADGDAERALSAFRLATEYASRAGAVVEEATYATGLAAAASNVGELAEALSSARRSLLLFEYLGRSADAARAMLSMAASYAACGAKLEARDAALDAAARAKSSGDQRCRGFAHLILADICELSDPEGIEHCRRATTLLGEDGEDGLRTAARLLARGVELDTPRFDTLARTNTVALDARLEWWTARARSLSAVQEPELAQAIIAELSMLASARAPVTVRGPALAAGAELAQRSSDGDMARRLTLAAGEAARELVRRVPAELKSAVLSLSWVRTAELATSDTFSPEQLTEVEALVRALGRRDRLRPLLRQVVDALVLWTGVERGLLLVRAPGGRLRPRAARNLLRDDLTGAQLELSQSLAQRALALGEPVVAVDAAGDLPEMHVSVHALKLRSVLAVPLIARGEALGVVYLDDRARKGAFGPRELSWVRLVATLAALAIADARDQLLLRRAARRAKRAEMKLARELARREAELDVAERELAKVRGGRESRFSYDAIVGQSQAVRSMLSLVDRVTTSEVPVLVLGESGSGKELIARAIHENGPRAGAPFVSENCSAIPEGLLESTLFGHVRGAFTGASRPRAGLFEIAHRGTLFLDEIAEMSLGMQTKLLRVLQDGEVRPVGSETARHADVRVIGATHRDIEALVAAGKFREDLYYRLNVITIRVPSLRERHGDIQILARHFVNNYAAGRKVEISRAALDLLSAYRWPGNVRQLENEIRRALVLADGLILPEHLNPEIAERPTSEVSRLDGFNLRQRIDALEVELVRAALRRTLGNQTRAAELLGLSRFGLQKMMKRLSIMSDVDRRALAKVSS